MAAPIKTLVFRGARHAPAILPSCRPRAASVSVPASTTMRIMTAYTTRRTASTTCSSSSSNNNNNNNSRHTNLAATTKTTTTTTITRFFYSSSLARAVSTSRTSPSSSSRAFTSSSTATPPPPPPTSPSSASSSSSSSSSDADADAVLDWNSFFRLRVKRRRVQVTLSLISGLVGAGIAAAAIAMGFAETLISMVPLEPMLSLPVFTVCSAGLGWLVGPTIGSQIFYLFCRSRKARIQQMESQFLAHIKKNRCDPSNSTATNPVPDFYGEKITSISGYRRWLKDQRVFNRKKNADFV